MTVELTLQETINLHQSMWNKIVETPCIQKRNVLIEMDWDPDNFKYNCFLCEYAMQMTGEESAPDMCVACPLEWPETIGNGQRCCVNTDADSRKFLFERWYEEDSIKRRRDIAKRIRDLSVRKHFVIDDLKIKESHEYFDILGVKDGLILGGGNILRIFKDGSGILRHFGLNSKFKCDGDRIKLVDE